MRRILLIIITLAALGGGGWLAWQRFGSQGGAVGEAGGAHSGLGKTVEPQKPTPVLTAVAVQNDMPVTLEGLGSVAAFYTVALKPQVDGRLTEVLFTEGQAVKKGDVLAKIDARPYRIALRQAEAVHDRDLAQLKNSKLNLQRYQELRKQNLVPTQQVSDQAAQVDQLQAQVRADESQEDSARLLLDYAQVVAPIEVQALEGDVAILSKGLQAGEVVVVDGQSRLKPGAKVALPGDVTDTKGGEGKGGEGKGGRGDKGPMGGKLSK